MGNIKDALTEYVKDAKKVHTEDHQGEFYKCPQTMCKLAREIEMGVSYERSNAILDIIEGK